MSDDQLRTDANSRDRSPDHQYSLSIEQAAEIYATAGHPRTVRAIQKYCALTKLDCHKVETETGEKYLVAPYSVERHIAYINEVRTVATRREQSRTDASVRANDDRYVARLEGEVEFLRSQVGTKDAQIKELTERSREMNVLVAGLQKMLTPLLSRGEDSRGGQDGREARF